MLTITAVGAVLAATAVVVTSSPATAAPTTKTLRSGDLDYSQSRSAGHNVIEGTALHVYTDDATSNAKAAGYFALNLPLSSIVATGEPSLSWAGSSPAPGNQLVADFDGDGAPDGILVGEFSVYGNDWWLTNGSKQFVKDGAPEHGGGFGSENHGTLDQWKTKFKDTTVLQGGYSLGSGVKGDGTIDQLTYGDTTINFTNSSPSTDVRHVGDMDFSDTRTAGHNVFLTKSLHVYTDDSTSEAKAAGFFPVNLALADVGEPSLDWTPTAPDDMVRPGTQLRIDFNGDGSFDGTLVGEPIYGHDWWTPDSAKLFVRNGAPQHTGGAGSANHGTIDQWRVAFPNAKVLTGGYSLGSGIKGDGVISAINIGTVAHTFANSSPTAANMSVITTAGHPVKITLSSTDADGDSVTYTHTSARHGTVSGTAPDLTYTPAQYYVGADSFTYTADDGTSTPATGTVTITVNKVVSKTTMVVTQNAPGASPRLRIKATVVANGAHIDTALMTIKDGTKTIGTARLVNGQINVLFTNIRAGVHTLYVYFPGSMSSTASSASNHLRVNG